MKDYNLQIKLRNANLLRAIKSAGYSPGRSVADAVGISYHTLNDYISLKRSPLSADGELSDTAEKICLFLNKMPSDLWSSDQLEPLLKNTAEVEVSKDDIRQLTLRTPDQILIDNEVLNSLDSLVDSLPERLGGIIRHVYGVGEEKLTLEKIGEKYNISKERVRRIESKALSILRSPYYRKKVGAFNIDEV